MYNDNTDLRDKEKIVVDADFRCLNLLKAYYGEEIYNKLNEQGIDTILDDRNERPGVKFNDMDLIGIPVRITIGKKIKDDILEIKLRKEDTVEECKVEDAVEKVKVIISK